MDNSQLSERDICTKFITPVVKAAGWDEMSQIRKEVNFTAGRIIVRGKLVTRGNGKRADYILYYKPNIPIALIEAKCNRQAVGAGMQQALEYADTLDILFASKQAVGQASISQPQVASMEIDLPSLAEQHQIVAKVDELMALCDRLEASLADNETNSRDLLEAVLHKALQTANETPKAEAAE